MGMLPEACSLCCWDLGGPAVNGGPALCRYCYNKTENGKSGREPAPPAPEVADIMVDKNDEEHALVLRAQDLDEQALAEIFNAYHPRMYSYGLAQLRDVQAAEDFASDVLLRVLDGIRKYRLREHPFSAWVFRIARNRLIDIQRRNAHYRQVPLDHRALDMRGAGEGPIKQLLDIDEISLSMASLTEAQAQVIVLRFLQDLDQITVARMLGRSERAIKSLQFRAITALRRTMSGPAAPAAPCDAQSVA